MEYTGERIIPDAAECGPDTLIYATHLARYQFAAPYMRSRRTLDIACGVGYGAQVLASLGVAPVIGGDISHDTLRYAARRYPHPHTNYVTMSAGDLPLPSSAVHGVVSFETIEHVPDANRFLAELKRVITPGGILVVSTPNRATYGMGHDVPDNEFHSREFSVTEFTDLLGQYFGEIAVFSQRRRVRHAPAAVRMHTLVRRMRLADRLGLRKLVPRGIRSLIARTTDAYDEDCGIVPMQPDDEPLFFVAVAKCSK